MALATYSFTDSYGDPVAVTVPPTIDTGVGSAPAARALTFTANDSIGHTTKNDYGVGSTRASRPRTAEQPQSRTITIDPGLAVNG